MAYPVEKVRYPSITMCPHNANTDRWGTPVKILDFLQRACEEYIKRKKRRSHNCTLAQTVFQQLSAEVDKTIYSAARDMLTR